MANFESLAQGIDCEILVDADSIESRSGDFGGVHHRSPGSVARPGNAEAVATLLSRCASEGIRAVARGAGHSQSGQSLVEHGLVIETGRLDRVDDPQGDRIHCGSGATWGAVTDRALAVGLAPSVLPNCLDMTVGGTLSVGGIGISSFRHGTQADNVIELEVALPDGRLVRTSREEEPDLFDGIRAGLGEFGVVTHAVIRLEPAPTAVRTHHYLYESPGAWMRDALRLMNDQEVSHLEGFCSPCLQGVRATPLGDMPFARWFFPLQVTVSSDREEPRILDELDPFERIHVEERACGAFFRRMEPVFDLWRESGHWGAAHPWTELIMPWTAAESFLEDTLERLPPPLLVGGHALLWPCLSDTTRVELFRTPSETGPVLGFGILPAVSPERLATVLPFLEFIAADAVSRGAKRYLSGYNGPDAVAWEAHFGRERLERMRSLKARVDPTGSLGSGFLPVRASGRAAP